MNWRLWRWRHPKTWLGGLVLAVIGALIAAVLLGIFSGEDKGAKRRSLGQLRRPNRLSRSTPTPTASRTLTIAVLMTLVKPQRTAVLIATAMGSPTSMIAAPANPPRPPMAAPRCHGGAYDAAMIRLAANRQYEFIEGTVGILSNAECPQNGADLAIRDGNGGDLWSRQARRALTSFTSAWPRSILSCFTREPKALSQPGAAKPRLVGRMSG